MIVTSRMEIELHKKLWPERCRHEPKLRSDGTPVTYLLQSLAYPKHTYQHWCRHCDKGYVPGVDKNPNLQDPGADELLAMMEGALKQNIRCIDFQGIRNADKDKAVACSLLDRKGRSARGYGPTPQHALRDALCEL